MHKFEEEFENLVNITVFQSSVLLFVKFDITGAPNDRFL